MHVLQAQAALARSAYHCSSAAGSCTSFAWTVTSKVVQTRSARSTTTVQTALLGISWAFAQFLRQPRVQVSAFCSVSVATLKLFSGPGFNNRETWQIKIVDGATGNRIIDSLPTKVEARAVQVWQPVMILQISMFLISSEGWGLKMSSQ